MFRRRGQANILVVVLLVVIVIVVSIIVFNVVNGVVSSGGRDVGISFKSCLQQLAKANCGDRFCNVSEETCDNCMADCGVCVKENEPLPNLMIASGQVSFDLIPPPTVYQVVLRFPVDEEECNSAEYIKYSNCIGSPKPIPNYPVYKYKYWEDYPAPLIRTDIHKSKYFYWNSQLQKCETGYSPQSEIIEGDEINWKFNYTCDYEICEGENCDDVSVESHFGMGGGLPVFPDELEDSGSEIVRQWIRWSTIEPADDVYDWTEMDAIVQGANQRDMEVLGYFMNVPTWARDMSKPKCNMLIKMPLDVCPILDWNDYTEFARNVAERYDGTNYICGEQGNEFCGEMKYIAIFNEVQGFSVMNSTEYAPWLIKGYQAIKQGNPNAKVLLGAVHSPLGGQVHPDETVPDFVDAMLRDYNQYYDIFNFHAYDFEDSFVGETIDYIKERMDNYNVDKPMWITETATFYEIVKCNDNLAWQDIVAKGVIKRYAQALGNDVEKVFWFSFVGLPTIEEDPRGVECGEPTNFLKGGLGWDVKPDYVFHSRPAYTTYQLMTLKLAGFTSVKKLTDTQYKYTFANKEPVYVLWCDEGFCPVTNEISGQVLVTDYLGNEQTIDASEIVLDESPIFVS